MLDLWNWLNIINKLLKWSFKLNIFA
jgi:hypothetical protein